MSIRIYSRDGKTYLVFKDSQALEDYCINNQKALNYFERVLDIGEYMNTLEFTTENYHLYLENRELTS